MYINIFTEREFQDASIEIVNIPIDNQHRPLLYSTGIHPWHINKKNFDKSLERFYIIASEEKCLAIGECGLDKSFESNHDLQEKVFLHQIKTANLLSKPLILYCFKSWKEVLDNLLKQKNKMPLIVPCDYLPSDNNLLAPINNYYISFDKSICLNDEKAITYLKNISSKKILFHNIDEDFSIKDIYQCASELLKIDLHTLQHQVLENFYRAFMLEKLPI